MTERTEGTSEVLEDLIGRIAGETEFVLTTRFDSDDGLHRDFVRWLHDSIDQPTTEFLNFPNGIISYKNKKLFVPSP